MISTTHNRALAACGLAILIPASVILGRSGGAIPGRSGIPANATTGFPSCGACHGGGSPGERGAVTTKFTGPAAIRKNSSATYGIAISSAVPGRRGGFALTTDKGNFIAGAGTQVGNAGKALTHTSSSSRSWSFKFSASQTGLAKWHAVGNTVDGNGKNKGDSWGFYGPNPSLPGAPFQVFVSDDQVTPYGNACNGSLGIAPLLGAAKNATRGAAFPVELWNVPGGTAAIGIFGFSKKSFGVIPLPFPLSAFGAPGCELNASMDILMPAGTAGVGRGGHATFGWFIPNLVSLKGVSIHLGALVIDKTANSFGMTNSNGLTAVIQ